ncbi:MULTISPECIES: 1-deoxy-D-xylulose-5-phosphate reductoisomerase [Marinomonas]|uniref:1-deoxy-D-xylulose 5-phosphate reductoisomerase n=1 Tax=Marinomonas arctica TaxID=383750 RepID=A0A7H1J969_9GAMM|nr:MULTISPECIES: 1-deoxy-D-xylulose-5-phosphate reductoisomerase [Marinomonas]MCS7487366.1 1-deoxy-D-xylulose 5-phosphate reductoisomerase [Marinomonas sp. BSi20414]QNT07035.1 1-deoxy-D-xylulose-5-phosphate reductoisomerase [Marinomonas arctica]GGN35256.1 1-deoxy-D-xylulose 5-phosphate reductoisomerase [Marinomonas arctica]
MQGICLLGATGSIGQSTLDIIALHPDKFSLISASANESVDKMAEICRRFKPQRVVMGSKQARDQLALKCQGLTTSFEWGEEALDSIAADPDVDQVMAAIMGFAGLKPTLAGIRAGKRILLANKESLVTAGKLFMDEVARHNVVLLPIDSEHNAIFQSLPQSSVGAHKKDVAKIILTASGGPFRAWSLEDMASVTPEQACKHPNWSMGQKISIDSATLMNKGLELIEACWLFDVTPNEIEVVVHPESIIHSMVSYVDGSVLAQMGNPDMKIPIAYGMSWPDRIDTSVAPLNLVEISRLNFDAPDLMRFPNLQLAADAWFAGGTAMAVLNAANEVAVAAFLNRQIRFLDIARINEQVLAGANIVTVNTLDDVFEADLYSRRLALDVITRGRFL